MPHLQSFTNHLITLMFALFSSALMTASEAEAGNFNHTQWRHYDAIVQQISNRHSIDPRLIYAVIWQESNFNRQAVSWAGAQGLMQLMPATARSLGVQSPFSARANIDGGTRYLIIQLRRFGSVKKALQAYHCGPERVATGRIPKISFRYANQVIARYRHIKLILPTTRGRHHTMLVAQND